MFIFRAIIVLVLAVITVAALIKNTNKWSIRFQKHAVSQMMQVFGDSEGWDDPWSKYLSKFMVIFLGLMFIIFAYVVCFSQ